MKLIIKEEQWKLNFRTGKQKVKTTDKKKIKCLIGKSVVFVKGQHCFLINDVTDDSVSFTVLYAEERHNKEWRLRKGERTFYRPFSSNDGYQYFFSVK